MNSFESNLLELEGERENMQVFYAGYDHNIFILFINDKSLMLFLSVNTMQFQRLL